MKFYRLHVGGGMSEVWCQDHASGWLARHTQEAAELVEAEGPYAVCYMLHLVAHAPRTERRWRP